MLLPLQNVGITKFAHKRASPLPGSFHLGRHLLDNWKSAARFIGIETFRKVKVFGPIKSRRTGYIFHFCQNQLSSAYKLSKLSKRSCYDQNIPNRGQQTINIFKSYWRTSSYAVHFFNIFHVCKKQLSCTYQLSKLSKWTYYVQNVPNRSQRTSNWLKIYWRTSSYAGVRARTPCIFFTLFNLVKNNFPVQLSTV